MHEDPDSTTDSTRLCWTKTLADKELMGFPDDVSFATLKQDFDSVLRHMVVAVWFTIFGGLLLVLFKTDVMEKKTSRESAEKQKEE